MIPIQKCRPNPYQPRKTFDADAIEELKTSIIEYGIIQPLILRRSIEGYEIVAGERRFRAAKEAGLEEIPAIVDRKSTRLNSSHVAISYAVFCSKKTTTRRTH